MKVSKQTLLTGIAIIQILCLSALYAEPQELKASYQNGKKGAKVSVTSAEAHRVLAQWEAGDQVFSVELNKEQIAIKAGDQDLASGSFKAGKAKLTNAQDAFYLEVKFQDSKFKIVTELNGPVCEIKHKGEKHKVYVNEKQVGKINYYPDTHKLKAKDEKENTVLELKGAQKPSAAPGAFLMTKTVEQKQVVTALLIMAMEQSLSTP